MAAGRRSPGGKAKAGKAEEGGYAKSREKGQALVPLFGRIEQLNVIQSAREVYARSDALEQFSKLAKRKVSNKLGEDHARRSTGDLWGDLKQFGQPSLPSRENLQVFSLNESAKVNQVQDSPVVSPPPFYGRPRSGRHRFPRGESYWGILHLIDFGTFIERKHM